MDTRSMAEQERLDLADLLASLTPEQWDAPTLCSQWRVRDVVAHVVSYDGLGPTGLAAQFVRGRFWPDRVNAVGVAQHRDRGPGELVRAVREHAAPSGLPALFGGRIALVDTLIHQQDIRRPLGLHRDVPADRLRAALPFAVVAPPIRAPWHVRGVRVVTTDVGWSHGRGPEARGPGEAVLMAMAGRAGAADDLDGPGAEVLRQRLG